jgi:SAM-dependent methyltransferase
MDRELEIFMSIHTGNPREAPGSAAATQRAFELCGDLGSEPRILDLGCGPGAQSLDLASLSGGTVTAVDLHAPYLDQLTDKARHVGLEDRVTPLCADMAELTFAPGSFDLVWSEGAIYNLGFRTGLETWRPLIGPEGCVAVSEVTWLVEEPPDEARAFWAEGYPDMQSIDANLEDLERAGFAPLGHFVLDASCWHEYYGHLEERMAGLEPAYAGDEVAARVFDAERQEIDVYRRHGESYGYVFYVARRTD